jgi:hypothetical protein
MRSEDGCNGSATAAAAAGRAVGSSIGSEVSTPTAAAVCNASPARFRAELLSLDDGMSESEVITSSEVMGPSYADVVCRTSREWSRGSSWAASKSPSPTRSVQHAAGHSSKATPKQQQQQDVTAGSSSQAVQDSKATAAVVASGAMAGGTAGVFFSFGHSSDGGSSSSSSSSSKKGHGASPARSPKAAAAFPKGAVHSPRSAAGAAGSKVMTASRLGCAAAVAGSAGSAAPTSVVAAAVAEAKIVKQQQWQGVVYNPKAFKAGDSSCNSTEGMPAGIAAATGAAAGAAHAVKPVAPDVALSDAPAAAAATTRADAAAKPSSASDNNSQQQQQQSSKQTHSSCTAAKKPQYKQGQQPKQADQQQQKAQPQPQLKVEVGKQTPAASPQASGLGTPGSPADCTAEVVTCDSSNTSSGNVCGSGRGALQKGKKQAAGTAAKGKGTLQAAAVTKGGAGKGAPPAASTAVQHVNSSDPQSQIGLLWKVAVVVVLLLSGGLLAALMLTRTRTSPQQGVTSAGSLDLQQQLAAMQDRVAVLQQQLTEKELQLATCDGWDPAAAVVDVDKVAMASDNSEEL